ncbi:NAD(P)-dependent oxidoreductase [Archangium violaceum]|uniref:NAD(P)-dependent oxidoreductase n=1 Tax=Archangium violaceum TaxID=83451 RepID=UPI002B2EC556|nr:NAD(P)-dependent oxidoreductase [Archangium violaceum]
MKPGIAVLGTGRMGSALVSAFLKQGYSVAIWNRTKSKCAPLAALGARVAETVRDAVADAELVVVNVNDYVTSDGLLRQDDVTKGLRGKLLVQLTSGSPRQAREMAAWARQHDIHYLDGAIMGTPNFIGAPGCTILNSGPGALFEKYKPVLLALGGNALHVGSDVGHASALDSALLVSMWGSMFGVLQAVSVCKAEELPLEAFMGYLKATQPVIDGAVDDFVKRIQTGRFAGDETTLATIDAHQGALRHLLELCKEHRIHHAVPAAFDQLFQAALQAGHAQDDFAVLHKFMK